MNLRHLILNNHEKLKHLGNMDSITENWLRILDKIEKDKVDGRK